MKKIQGFAVINDTMGKKVAYTYSEIDKGGNVVKSNVKESFVAIDNETLELISKLEEKINTRLSD